MVSSNCLNRPQFSPHHLSWFFCLNKFTGKMLNFSKKIQCQIKRLFHAPRSHTHTGSSVLGTLCVCSTRLLCILCVPDDRDSVCVTSPSLSPHSPSSKEEDFLRFHLVSRLLWHKVNMGDVNIKEPVQSYNPTVMVSTNCLIEHSFHVIIRLDFFFWTNLLGKC